VIQQRTEPGTGNRPVDEDVNFFQKALEGVFGKDGTFKTGKIETEEIINKNKPQSKDDGTPPMNDGTVGAFGTLFADFGKETVAKLHNIEMVANKPQLEAGIQMFAKDLLAQVSNPLAGLEKELRDVMKTVSNTIGSEIDTGAMLPNLRNEVRNFAGIAQQAAQQAQPAMQEMAQQAAPVLQDAGGEVFEMLNSKLSQLTDIGSKQFRTAERQLRSTKGLSGNLLKGL